MADFAEIPVGRLGLVAKVSPEDFPVLSKHKWSASCPGGKTAYATRQVHRSMCPVTGKQKHRTIYMHRVVAGVTAGQMVDHINHDGLDNTRENLRVASSSQNNHNVVRKVPRSGFRGVQQKGRGWIAQIQVNGRNIRSSPYQSKEDAARRYDQLALAYFGEFAILNFPRQG